MRNIYLIINLLITSIYVYYLLKISTTELPFLGKFFVKKVDKKNFRKIFLLLGLNTIINIFCYYLFEKNFIYFFPLHFLQILIVQTIYKSTLN